MGKMRIHAGIALIVGITVASCDDALDPSAPGTLVVSTVTDGNDPDTDGYLLTIDGAESVALDPTGTTEAELSPGRHTLRLLGVAEHCSVASATSLEVNVPPRGATSVAFEISCLLTGARITTATTGLDIDPDGFRIAVDGSDRGTVGSNDAVLTRMDPGNRTISLTAVASNCTLEGPSSRSVAVLDRQVASIAFEVVCTAATGVIKVVVEATGIDLESASTATVDGAMASFVQPGGPAYLEPVQPGDHIVALVPPSNCSIEDDEQPASVTAGGQARDTVEVTFAVHCVLNTGTLRVAAPTTGSIPAGQYSVWECHDFYCYYADLLGHLSPNDTLSVRVTAGSHSLLLYDVPARCDVSYPPTPLTLAPGDTLDVEFQVRCSI
jgi:hypothetical protein